MHASKSLPAGIWTALVTPFDARGQFVPKTYKALVARQLEAGIHALVTCGTTGEAATLSESEHFEVVSACLDAAHGAPVIAGGGSNSTDHAVAMHRKLTQMGVSASLQVTPYYNKPTQEGLYRHFAKIAESSDLPIILYNVPSRTGVDLQPQTVLRLVRDFPTVVGLKDTNQDAIRIQNFVAMVRQVRSNFLVLSGEDGFLLPFLSMGTDGLISVGSNFDPATFVSCFEAFQSHRLSEARKHFTRITHLTPLMFSCSNPIPVKTALAAKGLLEANFRLPLCPMNEAEHAQLLGQLRAEGWL